ncbi:MAG: DUF6913 domain-containing protein [Candidatus Cryptobacteroides sp.]
MLDFIKNIFRRRYLKHWGSTVATSLVPLDRIHSAAILINAEDKTADDCKEAVLAYFKKKGIKAELFFFDFGKKTDEELQITSLNNTTLKKDLNWCGRPSRDKMMQLRQSDCELFISLIDNGLFPVEYMAVCCRAIFKIGRARVNQNCFDMVIENPPGEEISQKEAFNAIVNFLETIQ